MRKRERRMCTGPTLIRFWGNSAFLVNVRDWELVSRPRHPFSDDEENRRRKDFSHCAVNAVLNGLDRN